MVRFSQALGFEGFPELQQAAREEYRRMHANGANGSAAAPLFSLDQTEFESVLAADYANVEQTARELDRDEVEAAVKAIAGAKLIIVCGTDQMAFFASYLRHLLMLLDHRCELVASPSQESISLLTASVDEEIERIFVRLLDDEALAPIAGRGQDVRERLAGLAVPRIAVSPLIGGKSVKGPLSKLLAELGHGAPPAPRTSRS